MRGALRLRVLWVVVWLGLIGCDNDAPADDPTEAGSAAPGDRKEAGQQHDEPLNDAGFQAEIDAGTESDAASDHDGAALPAPDELATYQPRPAYLAVDADAVYWTGGGYVWFVPLSGGDADTLTPRLDVPTAITVHAGSLYWIDTGKNEIVSLLLPDGKPVRLATFPAAQRLQGIVVDGSHAFVTWAYWNESNVASGGVVRVSLADGTREMLAAVDGEPFGLTLTGDFVYWATRGATSSVSADLVTTYAPGNVQRVAKVGGTPEVIAQKQGQPRSIVTDDQFAYWTAETDGAVMKAPLSGGSPTVIASGQDHPWGLQVDATHVYWTTYAGQVLRAPLAGGAPEVLADLAPLNARGIVVDDAHAYVVAFKSSGARDGKVVRIRK